jgi:hypothetical protein
MVIDDLDQLGPIILPHEAEASLIVDPDAVLALPVALERFEAVAGRCPEIGEPGRRVKHVELAQRHRFDGLQPGHSIAPVQRLGALVVERPDHPVQI